MSKIDETVPGGRYLVGGVWVDANGKPLPPELIPSEVAKLKEIVIETESAPGTATKDAFIVVPAVAESGEDVSTEIVPPAEPEKPKKGKGKK